MPCPDYATVMAFMPSLNPRIVDALHAEALGLADAVRTRFEALRREALDAAGSDCEDLHRVRVSCEALRTTTRVMHCLAWLLNHRAYFAGELSQLQLRRHGRLITNFPASEPEVVASLPDDARTLVHESERLYERIQRLENAWRTQGASSESAIDALRQRLVRAVAGTSDAGTSDAA